VKIDQYTVAKSIGIMATPSLKFLVDQSLILKCNNICFRVVDVNTRGVRGPMDTLCIPQGCFMV